jgi:hypothetical protein
MLGLTEFSISDGRLPSMHMQTHTHHKHVRKLSILVADIIELYLFYCYISFTLMIHTDKKLRDFGPLANYADRATAACWRSSANFCG